MESNDKIEAVDIEKMSIQEIDALSKSLSNEISKILKKANEECDKIAKKYGLKVQTNFQIKKAQKESN